MSDKEAPTPCCFFKRHRYDIVILSVIALVCILSLILSLVLRESATRVCIEIDGRTVATHSLSDNGEYPLLEGKCTLVISDGEVYMSDADCPDGTCVRTGKIRYSGQSIICLPNRITVRLVGEGGVDIVS